jgi:hypothetical protein
MAILQRLPVDDALLASFCARWKVAKLELFGSMITDPSNARDIDLLVTFAPDAMWGLLLLRETPKRVLFEEVLGKMGFKRQAFFPSELIVRFRPLLVRRGFRNRESLGQRRRG